MSKIINRYLLISLLAASSAQGAVLIDNLGAPATTLRGLSATDAFGTSFLTGVGYYTTDTLTLNYNFNEPATPDRVRLFRVSVDSGGAEQTTFVGEFGNSTPPEGLEVTYSADPPLLLFPNTEYIIAVNKLDEFAFKVLEEANDTASGSEVGYTFTSNWGSSVEQGEETWFRYDSWLPIKFQLQGTSFIPANQPPDVSQAVASVPLLWPPNGRFVPVNVLGITDPDGHAVTVTITAVQQDEPPCKINAILAGDTVALRAERDGSGSGRVYKVSFQADDGEPDGVVTGEVYVTVPMPKKTAALDEGPIYGYYDSTVF